MTRNQTLGEQVDAADLSAEERKIIQDVLNANTRKVTYQENTSHEASQEVSTPTSQEVSTPTSQEVSTPTSLSDLGTTIYVVFEQLLWMLLPTFSELTFREMLCIFAQASRGTKELRDDFHSYLITWREMIFQYKQPLPDLWCYYHFPPVGTILGLDDVYPFSHSCDEDKRWRCSSHYAEVAPLSGYVRITIGPLLDSRGRLMVVIEQIEGTEACGDRFAHYPLELSLLMQLAFRTDRIQCLEIESPEGIPEHELKDFGWEMYLPRTVGDAVKYTQDFELEPLEEYLTLHPDVVSVLPSPTNPHEVVVTRRQ